MSAWWAGLSLRERGLVLGAGGITLLVLLWQLLLVPLMDWRGAAEQRSLTAQRDLQTLHEAYFKERAERGIIVVDSEKPAALTGEAFKSEVVRLASENGLSITRLQGDGPNVIGITINVADPRIVFLWLQEVELGAGGAVTRMVLESVEDELVRVNIDFEAGAT